ncbi:class I SAM-dependent methyltransferase [Ornithinimicrobium avium]|uniref:Class I SAM-dependent methyltransferase n=1 Tax=Ornithinimicrobium avium TaxID=2283195 RepID=A0A345NNU6_9MICO|nr:class I SAM-dependent methyltransferase [Ornithinimicrobium avium]
MGAKHFDERASTWDDDPDKRRHGRDVARAVAAAAPARESTRLLEYGAGTGLVTQGLLEILEGLTVTLADSSSGMRAVLEAKIADGTLPKDARVWDLDLEHDAAPQERFDLVVTSMVLHHVQALPTVLEGFAALLEDGGLLCVVDLDREDGSFHEHLDDFHGHRGFDRAEIVSTLQDAGFVGVTVQDCTQIEREDGRFQVFLAVGRRAARTGGA